MPPVITTESLEFSYGDTPVLRGLDLSVEAGEVICLLGPNGVGKTTLVENLLGSLTPTSGRVRVLGTDPRRAGADFWARVGLVQQSWTDHAKWKVRDQLEWIRSFQLTAASRVSSVDEVLDAVGLSEKADSRLSRLSGGQRRTIDFAAALMAAPELLVLDEPTTGLDPASKARLHDLILARVDDDATIVMTTHDLAEAEHLASRVLIMNEGRIIAGSIGTISCFITFQIASEAYVDRIGGALLRVRVLPHGPLTWAIGKTMSSVTQTLVFQGAILLGGALFVEALPLSTAQVLACLPLMVLSAVATAPLGFLVGAFVRGVYSFMASYLPMFALIGTSGFFMPMDRLPSWLQAVQLMLPTYWSGHLTRWALVGDPSWEVGQTFFPALAVGVLATWAVLGFAGASFIVRRSFRKETIGSLARMQSTIRSQSGL